MAIDEALHAFGYTWLTEREFENAVEGLIIAGSVYWLSRLQEKQMLRPHERDWLPESPHS
jgi:hypothetical protein